jgi:tRNA-specific 2-thiouridylase
MAEYLTMSKGKLGKKPTVYVAMSGGVDSSVAATLLKKQGFNVVGVFMRPWQDPLVPCLWQNDHEDALRVAAVLNISLLTWDFSREYGKYITKYMIDGYRKGLTPNPDVMCNKEIKFGLFFKRAIKEGADFVATGHYARTKNGEMLTAEDSNKDQTYFLWTLTRDQLSKTIFPIGDYKKPEVRKLAKKFKLPTATKKDSQGICFVGSMNVKAFLKRHIKPRNGKILDINNRVIGEHDGAWYYTIGQRHGLNITLGNGPYFVVSKDIKKNIVVVGGEKDLNSKTARISEINWINEKPKFPLNISVKIRYRTPAVPATLLKNGKLEFKKPQRAVTPGQSAVFYLRNKVLGGGIIEA